MRSILNTFAATAIAITATSAIAAPAPKEPSPRARAFEAKFEEARKGTSCVRPTLSESGGKITVTVTCTDPADYAKLKQKTGGTWFEIGKSRSADF